MIALYKVVFRGDGFLSHILAGIDQAVLDGVDMLSISLGSISSVTGASCSNTFDIAQLLAVKEKTYVYTCTTNTPNMALA
ncbi:unnamed protein product [Sphagnum balticum]